MYNFADLQAFRARQNPGAGFAVASHNRSDTQIVPAQTKGQAFAHLGAQKFVEGILAFALGALDAGGGEPQFLTSAADPNAGFGLKALLAFLFNGAQIGFLATGWTPSKKIGGALGAAADGALAGAASASWITFAYAQGNLFGTARATAATKGVELDYTQQPHMLPVHHSPPAPRAVDPVVAQRVAQGRAASMQDPNAAFF